MKSAREAVRSAMLACAARLRGQPILVSWGWLPPPLSLGNGDMDIDDEVASLRKQAAEARLRAAAIAKEFSWARAKPLPAPAPPLSSVLSDGPIDVEELTRAKKRAQARRMLDREMEASGLAERWRSDDARQHKAHEAQATREKIENAGALGKLFSMR